MPRGTSQQETTDEIALRKVIASIIQRLIKGQRQLLKAVNTAKARRASDYEKVVSAVTRFEARLPIARIAGESLIQKWRNDATTINNELCHRVLLYQHLAQRVAELNGVPTNQDPKLVQLMSQYVPIKVRVLRASDPTADSIRSVKDKDIPAFAAAMEKLAGEIVTIIGNSREDVELKHHFVEIMELCRKRPLERATVSEAKVSFDAHIMEFAFWAKAQKLDIRQEMRIRRIERDSHHLLAGGITATEGVVIAEEATRLEPIIMSLEGLRPCLKDFKASLHTLTKQMILEIDMLCNRYSRVELDERQRADIQGLRVPLVAMQTHFSDSAMRGRPLLEQVEHFNIHWQTYQKMLADLGQKPGVAVVAAFGRCDAMCPTHTEAIKFKPIVMPLARLRSCLVEFKTALHTLTERMLFDINMLCTKGSTVRLNAQQQDDMQDLKKSLVAIRTHFNDRAMRGKPLLDRLENFNAHWRAYQEQLADLGREPSVLVATAFENCDKICRVPASASAARLSTPCAHTMMTAATSTESVRSVATDPKNGR